MTAHVIVLTTPNPEGTAHAKAYAEGVQPLLKAASATVLFKSEVGKKIAGATAPKTAMVLSFASPQVAREFFEQDEYQALVPARDAGFSHMDILVLG